MKTTRIKLEGESAVYHCISRVVGGQKLLGEPEREKFRQLMRRQARFAGLEILTYCLMANHVHLLVRVPEAREPTDREVLDRALGLYKPKEPVMELMARLLKEQGKLPGDMTEPLKRRMGDISVFMKELKMGFSKWYNRRHGRFGAFWAERFKSVVVEDEPSTVRTVAAYIDLNPVRAGLVEDPKDYRHCGYAEAVAGVAEARSGIAYFHPAGKKWREVAESYRKYLYVGAGRSGQAGKAQLDAAAIRRVLDQGGRLSPGEVLRLKIRHLSEGAVLGSGEYVEEVFERFRERLGSRRKSGAKRIGRYPLGDMKSLRDPQDH